MKRPLQIGPARDFLLIWFGQTISLVGSRLSFFALGVWIFQTTGSASQFTLAVALGVAPGLLLGPFVGALIDRWDRRWAMILADTGSALIVVVLAMLVLGVRLEVWHIYLAIAVGSIFDAAQVPAYSAAVTLLVDKRQLGRANGLIQFGESGAKIIAPAAAGLLLPVIGLAGILWIDLGTFVFALVTLALAHVPRPEPQRSEAGEAPSLWREAAFGWQYIRRDPGLKALLVFFAVFNLLWGVNFVLITPLVLSFASETELGFVLAVASAASLVGGLVMSAWGGPRRLVYGILGFCPLIGVGSVLMGLRPSIPLIAVSSVVIFFGAPVITASSQAIWQARVPVAIQGKVFAIRRLVSHFTVPVAFYAGGPLADHVFEPLMAPDGALADTAIGSLLGVGAGRGIGLLFILIGLLIVVSTTAGFFSSNLREVEGDEATDEEPAIAEPPVAPAAVAEQPASSPVADG